MSREWGLYCKKCELSSVFANHAQRLFREVVRVWPQINAITNIPDLWYVEVRLSGYDHVATELFDYLREHSGHQLVLCDENGHMEATEEAAELVEAIEHAIQGVHSE